MKSSKYKDIYLHASATAYAAGGRRLGRVQALYRRMDQSRVDPAKKVFSDYVEIVNLDIGDDFYIPTNYISHSDEDGLYFSKSFEEIKSETLNRKPRFIAHGRSQPLHLLPKPEDRGMEDIVYAQDDD